jgi:hypothetical protein
VKLDIPTSEKSPSSSATINGPPLSPCKSNCVKVFVQSQDLKEKIFQCESWAVDMLVLVCVGPDRIPCQFIHIFVP